MASRLFFRQSTANSSLSIPAPPGTPGQEAILIKHCYFRYHTTTTSSTQVYIRDSGDPTTYYFDKSSAAPSTSNLLFQFEVHDLLCINPVTGEAAQGVEISNAFANASSRGLHVVYQYVPANYSG